MALESQGVYIRRESTVAGSTALVSDNTLSFEGTSREIRRQSGFADYSTGMRLECNASLNTGVYTISATAGTAVTVYEAITDQASGSTVTLEGHAMQNIGQVVSFNGPQFTGNIIDVTHLQSTAKEKVVGLVDAGNLAISVIWDNEASNANLHDAMMTDFKARTKRKYDVKFTDEGSVSSQPSAVYFEGYLTGFAITGAVDQVRRADITIAISTGVDWIDAV